MWSEESSTEQETTGGSVGSSGVNFKVGVHKGQGSLLSSTRTAATLRGKLAVDEDEEDVGKAGQLEAEVKRLMHAAKQAAESGNLDAALATFDRLLFYKPDHAVAHEMRAQLLNNSGQTWAAVQAATQAVSLSPTWGDAWLTLARCQANLGELKLALESFAKAEDNNGDVSGSEQDVAEWVRLVQAQEQDNSGQASRIQVVTSKD